jgi:hypothetical protein
MSDEARAAVQAAIEAEGFGSIPSANTLMLLALEHGVKANDEIPADFDLFAPVERQARQRGDAGAAELLGD